MGMDIPSGAGIQFCSVGKEMLSRECTAEDLYKGGFPMHLAEFEGCEQCNDDEGLEHPCMTEDVATDIIAKFGVGDWCYNDCGSTLSHPCSTKDIMTGAKPVYKMMTKPTQELCVAGTTAYNRACTAEDLTLGAFPMKPAEFEGCGQCEAGEGLEHPCMTKSAAQNLMAKYGVGDSCYDDCGTVVDHPCAMEDVMKGSKPVYRLESRAAELAKLTTESSSVSSSMLVTLGACVAVAAVALFTVTARRASSAEPAYTPV